MQGTTSREGAIHATRNKAYGAQVVAGVTPGKAPGRRGHLGVNTVADAVQETGANAAMACAPPRFATDALYEAIESGVDLIVCITEGIPAQDMRVGRPRGEGDPRREQPDRGRRVGPEPPREGGVLR